MIGEFEEVSKVAAQAQVIGVTDIRLLATEAASRKELGAVDEARKTLSDLLKKASGDDRPYVLNHWLNLRLDVDHASYEEVIKDVLDSDRADPNLHLSLAQAAMFSGNEAAFDAHMSVLESAKEKIGDWIPKTVNAMAAIIRGERRGVRQGVPLVDLGDRERVQEASTFLAASIQQRFSESPFATNKESSLVWLARAATLLGQLTSADDYYRQALEASRGDDKLIALVAQYASDNDRADLWDALLNSPEAQKDSRLLVVRASRAVSRGEPGARVELRRIAESETELPEASAQAVAGRLYLSFDAADTPDAVQLALSRLGSAGEPDQIVIGLALSLREPLLGEETLQRIRSELLSFDSKKLQLKTLLEVAGIFSAAKELELRNAMQAARDAAVDAQGDLLTRTQALQAIQLALSELRLARAEDLLDRYLPRSDLDAASWGLRSNLAIQRGNIDSAAENLRKLATLKLANVNDIARWVWFERSRGNALFARHMLTPSIYPRVEKTKSLAVLVQTLASVTRRGECNRLLAEVGSQASEDKDLFPAAAAVTMAGGMPPVPKTVNVNTVVVLRHETSGETRMFWITERSGTSARAVTRVAQDEPWVAPLLGCAVGEKVHIDAGEYAGTWTVDQLLSGAVGTHARVMDWASRQGIAGGGVDALKIPDDDLVGPITERLRDDLGRVGNPPQNVPIIMLSHFRNTIPFRVVAKIERPRCCFGTTEEMNRDARLLQGYDTPFYVDPLTILFAEQTGITPILLKAAGNVKVMRQTQLTLIDWWWEERQHRHARASAGLTPDGKLFLQEHTPKAREWGRKFWKAIAARQTDYRVKLVDYFADDSGAELSNAEDILDIGTLATLAAARTDQNIFLSIDGFLFPYCAGINVRGVTLFGLLQWAASIGRITWLESATAKARLSRANWSFITVRAHELAATMSAHRDNVTNANRISVSDLLKDYPVSEPSAAVRVAIDALYMMSNQPQKIRTRAKAELLFRALPKIPRSHRAQIANATRGSWFYKVARAWAK